MIKAISFDLDGTLVDEKFDTLIWDEEIPRLYAEKHHVDLERAKDKVYADYYRALYKEKETRWKDIEYWMERLKLGDWKQLVERFKHAVLVYPDVIPMLTELKKHYTLIVVSGADEKFLNVKMDAVRLKRYFDHIFSAPSHFHVAEKSAKMFLAILQKLKLNPEELVHVGDLHEHDYLVPQQIGIHAFHILRGRKRAGEHELTSLTELPEKIKKLS